MHEFMKKKIKNAISFRGFEMKKEHEILFDPINIGKVELKNRFAMSPMGTGGMAELSGAFNRQGVEYYLERAKGGVGLIQTGLTVVENELEGLMPGMNPCTDFNPPEFIKAATLMTERIHAYDTKMFLQITAGGGRINRPAWTKQGRSLISSSVNPNRWNPEVKTRELTTEEVKYLIKRLVGAAVMAKASGFDGVNIHAVHEGYLMDQFTMACFNRRCDEYGGTLEGRLQFPIQVLQGIKAACGKDFPVVLRYSLKHMMKDFGNGALPGEEFKEIGRDFDEGLAVAKLLEQAGFDAFDADVGSYDAHFWSHPPMYMGKGVYLPFNALLKEVLTVPVISAGRMDDPDLASKAVREGKTDLIGLGRPLLADPQLVNKIRRGEFEEIRPCMSCHDGCFERIATLTSCAVNPACGREKEYGITKAEVKKKVVIVGGGPTGCEAARVCAERGHEVTMFEKTGRLGGNLLPAGVPDFKENDLKLAFWYTRQLDKLGVDTRLNTAADKATIDTCQPDAVILATGSTPKQFNLGGDLPHAVATDVLTGKFDCGDGPVILGGGLVGCELALWLLGQGRQVTIIELLPKLLSSGEAVPFPNKDMLEKLLAYHHCTIHTGTEIVSTESGKVTAKKDDSTFDIPASSLVFAVGFDSERLLSQEFSNESYDVFLLGDARKVRNIMHAVWDAYEVARNI